MNLGSVCKSLGCSTASSHIPQNVLEMDSKLPVGVNVSMNRIFFLSVFPAIGWRTISGVPRLSPIVRFSLKVLDQCLYSICTAIMQQTYPELICLFNVKFLAIYLKCKASLNVQIISCANRGMHLPLLAQLL